MTKLKRISNVILSVAIAAIPVALAIRPEVSNAIVMASIIAVCPMIPALILDAIKGE